MIPRHVLLLILISAPVLAADPLELSVMGITGDHLSAKKFGHLSVVATNRGSDEPLVFTWISVEKKNGDGKFSSFRTDIECPCDAKCKKAPITLKKSESRSAEWDLLGGYHCEIAGPGVYRFAVIARYSEAASGYVYHGASKEFTITE